MYTCTCIITELALRINNKPMMYMYTCMYHYRSLTYTQLYGWSSLLMLIWSINLFQWLGNMRYTWYLLLIISPKLVRLVTFVFDSLYVHVHIIIIIMHAIKYTCTCSLYFLMFCEQKPFWLEGSAQWGMCPTNSSLCSTSERHAIIISALKQQEENRKTSKT